METSSLPVEISFPPANFGTRPVLGFEWLSDGSIETLASTSPSVAGRLHGNRPRICSPERPGASAFGAADVTQSRPCVVPAVYANVREGKPVSWLSIDRCLKGEKIKLMANACAMAESQVVSVLLRGRSQLRLAHFFLNCVRRRITFLLTE